MSVRIISNFMIVLLLVTGIFAQTYEEQQRMDEDRQRLDELSAQLSKRSTPEFAGIVESFLPGGKDSWTVSLTRSGGIMGGKVKLIGLVNSNGSVACTGKNRRLSEDALKDMGEFIRGSDLKTLRKQFNPEPLFCTDCYVTTMEITYRNLKKKKRVFRYGWFVLPESSPEIKQFYEKVEDYAACQ